MESRRSQSTVYGLVMAGAERDPTASAISCPGREPLSYERLDQHIRGVADSLRSFGMGRTDRVAVVMENGPEMATALIAVMCCCICVPLNPDLKARELEFYLSDLKPKAVIVEQGSSSAIISVALKMGIQVIELVSSPDQAAGVFELRGQRQSPPSELQPVGESDIAMILHTSGTTARPKIVPIAQKSLFLSARNVSETLNLSHTDRSMNIMPLFHTHGLVGAVFASLYSGGCAICTTGLLAGKFFAWMQECKPTWYSAVPSMHQMILQRAGQHLDVIRAVPLRFLRSASSPLPVPVMTELEKVFSAPVIEVYGMTESAHQITSNPLPPGKRKPGSVGVAAGPEVAISDENGRHLQPNEVGEIVIRGETIIRGYEEDPAANARSFRDGWLRTGDLGYLDSDGYLFISGRSKEMINRAGEKISPREIDEALLSHPCVAQAVAFAVPDPKLGEAVAAAVVLRPGTQATETEILDFAALRISDFKVPSRLLILTDLPKGATGKVQRNGLAERLGLVPQEKLSKAG